MRKSCWTLGLVMCITAMFISGVAPRFVIAQDGGQGAPGLGDPFYDGLGNGGYDTLHYTIDLDIEVDTNAISGTTTIEAEATQTLTSFNLDFPDWKFPIFQWMMFLPITAVTTLN